MPAVVPAIKIAMIIIVPQTLLTPETKEFVVDTELGGKWINRNPWQVSRKGVNRSTPGEIRNAVSVGNAPSPVMIGIVGTSLSCGFNKSLQVVNKWNGSSSGLVGQTQKLDAVVDRKLPNDLDSASIFSKVIGHKLSNDFSVELSLRCRINFAVGTIQTQAPKFTNLGFSAINTLDESSAISTLATRI